MENPARDALSPSTANFPLHTPEPRPCQTMRKLDWDGWGIHPARRKPEGRRLGHPFPGPCLRGMGDDALTMPGLAVRDDPPLNAVDSAEEVTFFISGSAEDAMKGVLEDRHAQWKSLVPALYDWLTNHHLMWPSLSCRWGPQIEAGSARNRQLLFYSERTDGECPNTIVVSQCDIMKPRTAAADHISQFKDGGKSPHLKKLKTIIHPGEVNRIRELPQNSNILATHTDSPEVLIWNTKTQPNRATTSGSSESKPNLVLKGHTDNAEFALNLGRMAPYVISGGRDQCVVLWSIEDHITSMQTPRAGTPSGGGSKQSGTAGCIADATHLYPRGIFKGHTNTVEDVQFRPSSVNEFCSVGDDSCLLLWDARAQFEPILKVENAHSADLHCVDWNAHDENLLLTGSADNSVRLFDHRKISGSGQALPVGHFEGHSAAVLCVQWCPDRASVFGSCAEDGLLNVWDFEKVGKALDTSKLKQPVKVPSGLFFQHTGHRDKVVDFHWDLCDPWTIVSVSEDANTPGGGGTLQIWRMIDFIYRNDDEVLAELEVVRPQLVTQNAAAS